MPKNSIISEGNTTNEAIENGLKILNVSKNMVNVKVLENEGMRSAVINAVCACVEKSREMSK